MKVILISGKAQHGKDSVAEIIKTKLEFDNKKVLVTHYADLLKYICTSYFNWNGVKDEDGRRLLQYVGTDVIRKQTPNYWVNFTTDILKYFGENWDYVIIPDCRFPNEIDVVKSKGFDATHLRVVRDNFNTPLTPEQQKHLSETALDDVEPDYYINNTGTYDDLVKMVNKWVVDSLYI